MRILVVTGRRAAGTVGTAAGNKAEVLVLDIDVAAFTTPNRLKASVPVGKYDLIIIPGLITADFSRLEKELDTPIRLGPRHAADLGLVLAEIDNLELSPTVPACELLTTQRRETALKDIEMLEAAADPAFYLKDLKIGGSSIMKVMAEIVDAASLPMEKLKEKIYLFQAKGADIIDLGLGMDATPAGIRAAAAAAKQTAAVPISIDTLDPDLINAAVESGVDMVLSLNSANMEMAGPPVAGNGIAAVVIPDSGGGLESLAANIKSARSIGITRIIADPVLDPPGQGMADSIMRYRQFRLSHPDVPLFFGAGNITELMDVDTVGVNGLLAAIGREVGADILFTPEYSDKARGSISELKLAAQMLALAGLRSSSPKDLGIDLLVLKEKRMRPFDIVPGEFIAAKGSYQWTRDPAGSFRISISESTVKDGVVEPGKIIARHTKYTIVGDTAQEVLDTAIDLGMVSRLEHAAYLGRELGRAELALRMGRSFAQDDRF